MNVTNTTPPKDSSLVEYVPHGGNDPIKLSLSIVKNLIAVPTRSGKQCSDRDALKFLAMCRARRLNPFEGDAFLVGYDGKNGPEFSLITAHQAFLKRAELHPEFDGMKSGIILRAENGTLTDQEGDFHLEEQSVVGGWATVFFKNRSVPTHRRIRLERFNKGFAQWQVDPAGMICKCAEADALRSSFPTMLGGLYLREEHKPQGDGGAIEFAPTVSDMTTALPNATDLTQSEQPKTGEKSAETVQHELADLVTSNGFTLDQLLKWGTETGNLPEADTVGSFEEINAAVAKRLLRARVGLLKGLSEMKGQTV